MQSQASRQFQPPVRAESVHQKYDANSMTRTHFLLGNEKSLGVTTANASYRQPPAEYTPSVLDEKTKADLRKSHFHLGAGAGRFITTNKVDYVPKQGTGSERNDQEERKGKMRKHNFNFGKEDSNFVSTNNAAYQNFSGTGIANNSAKTSTDITRTHFQLGGENAPMRTVHQSEYREKTGLVANKTKDTAAHQCTNFKFGDDKTNHISSAHMHFKHYPGHDNSKLNREQLNELRKEHFILGKQSTRFQSVSHMSHGDKGMAPSELQGSKQGFQRSSVRIGDPNLAKTYFQTTYEVSNQSRPLGNNIYNNKNIAKEGSHFQIGDGSRPIGKSQNQVTYRELDPTASKIDYDFVQKIKSNHFELGTGSTLPGQYRSVTQGAFNDKGNPAEIKAKLDEQRKNDLTASHFKVGGDKVPMRSTMQGSYVPMVASQSAFNEDKKRDLKNSHFMIGKPGEVDFQTSNGINYRWVQPRETLH
jgi:hypothetical protein